MIRLFYIRISQYDDSFFLRVGCNISKISRRARLRIIGEILIRYVMYILYGKVSIEISRMKSGKPFLVNESISYNISHSGDILILCVDEYNIGIDIEQVIPRNAKLIASSFFTPSEYNTYIKLNEDIRFFYKIWTLKESYFKYTGEGISKAIKEIDVLKYSDSKNKNNIDLDEVRINFNSFTFLSQYIVSICAIGEYDNLITHVKPYELEEVIKKISSVCSCFSIK